MYLMAVFLHLANQNLLLGFIPESLGLLLFGIGLVALTMILRGIFRRVEQSGEKERIEN